MNNKILVEVFVPLLNQEYDIFIPINKKIGNVVRLINEAINDLSNGCFPLKKDTFLYSKDTGMPLNLSKNVKDAGLVNGSQIVLI